MAAGADAAAEAMPEAPPVPAARFRLQVNAVSGECLAVLPQAEATWQHADVAPRLPELLPGHKYQLLCGKEVLEESAMLGERFSHSAEDCACLTAVVVKTANAQEEMDLALISAAGELDTEQVNKLLRAGASAAFVHDPPGVWGSSDKKSALHLALQAYARASQGSSKKEAGAGRAVVESLLDAKADVNAARDQSDWRGCGSSSTAFEMALPLAMRDASLLQRLLMARGDPNTKKVSHVATMRTDGTSTSYVLHKAVHQGSLDAARALLDAGATVDAVQSEHMNNERGFNKHMDQTGLHVACGAGDIAMAALLLERRADVNAVRRDLQQESIPMDSASRVTDDPRDPMFRSTVRCVPVEETALHIAIRRNLPSLVTLLVCAGADRAMDRSYGEAIRGAEELCAGDAKLLEALGTTWSPSLLSTFPEELRPGVEAAVAAATTK